MVTINGGSFQTNQFQLEQLKSKTNQLENSVKSNQNKDEALYKVCEEFESIFTGMMLKAMRQTVDKSGLADGGFGEEIFESMLDEEYSKIAAQRNGSIANLLYQQLRLHLDQS